MITATRRLQFCSGHRVHRHESKCANVHGHNYVLYFTAKAPELDPLGRVIDFGVMKEKLGRWIDENWDHGFVYWNCDPQMVGLFAPGAVLAGHKHYAHPTNPTAENMALHLLHDVCPKLFEETNITIVKIVLCETENCSAEVTL